MPEAPAPEWARLVPAGETVEARLFGVYAELPDEPGYGTRRATAYARTQHLACLP